MDLSESMHELAKVLVSLPSGYRVDVDVTIPVNDQIPSLFIEMSNIANQKKYRRVIETEDGIATRSITLWMPS